MDAPGKNQVSRATVNAPGNADPVEITDGSWPSARWKDALADPLTPDVILRRVAEGETLKEICRSRGWPYSMVAQWMIETPGMAVQYEQALAFWGDAVAQETLAISDESAGAANPYEVTAAKLRIDTRLKLASRWNRARYGETPAVTVNAGGGSLVAILAGLPSIGAPESDEREPIDVTPAKPEPAPAADADDGLI